MSGFYKYKCKCGKTFLDGNAFSSHRCKYKKNAGAFIDKELAGVPTFKVGQRIRYRKKGQSVWTEAVISQKPRRIVGQYRENGTGPVQEVDYGIRIGVSHGKESVFINQIRISEYDIEPIHERYIHCYVCGKMRKQKNFMQHTIAKGLMTIDEKGEPTGEFIERSNPDPDDPHYYAVGCCVDCAPKEGIKIEEDDEQKC